MKPNPSSQNQLSGEKGRISRNPSIQPKRTTPLSLIALVLAWFVFFPEAKAVSPPPDGCYPGFTTAEGCDALKSLTTGAANTGVGWRSLFLNTTGGFNTALGTGALALNNGDSNTATGAAALLVNTTGNGNTAVGDSALLNNTTGNYNTATGYQALYSNIGSTFGNGNTANGYQALFSNTKSGLNTALGYQALFNNNGGGNAAIGYQALFNNHQGSGNVAVGYLAGSNITGNSNIAIGSAGVAGVDSTTWIAHIHNSVATARAVYVNEDGKLGTLASSRRFKDDIKPMDKTSEGILALKPVTFRYKKESDSSRVPQFGLVAEDVAKVNPDLVVRDEKGEIYSVRYEAVNAMLLNEFLKEHRRVEEQQATINELKFTASRQQANIATQEATIADLKKGMDVLTAQLKEHASQIQKVSSQLEMSKTTPNVVLNNR